MPTIGDFFGGLFGGGPSNPNPNPNNPWMVQKADGTWYNSNPYNILPSDTPGKNPSPEYNNVGQIIGWDYIDLPGGGGGYAPPEWRPGELDLLLKQFYADTANQNLDRASAERGQDLQYKLGLKQVAMSKYSADLDNALGIKQLRETRRANDLQNALGIKQLEMQKYEADLDHELGLEGLRLDWAKLDFEKSMQEAGLDLQNRGLLETIRSNKASEYGQSRERALTAAQAAVSAYLQGQSQADARRATAASEARLLLPSLVDPNQQYFSGQEPGGILATMAQRFGLPYQAPLIQHKVFNPAALAAPPTESQVGSGIMDYINGLGGFSGG